MAAAHHPVERGGPAAERDDEAQQIDREREHPEQGKGGDVRGDVGGDAEEQARGGEGERHPVEAPADGRRGPAPLGGLGRRRRRGRHAAGVRCGRGPRGAPPDGDDRAEDDQDGEQEIAEGPQPCLREPPGISELEARLDQRGVAQQREHAPEIARGVEEVGVAGGPVTRVREPVLQERRGRAHHEEGQAHREREQDEHAQHGVGLAPGQAARVDAEGQDGERDGEQRQVQDRLPADAEPRRGGVGIGVAAEERGLEEHHARAPDGGRAAEERQDHLAHHRLHHEQERGADEQRGRVEQQDERQAEILQPPIVAAPATFSYGAGC